LNKFRVANEPIPGKIEIFKISNDEGTIEIVLSKESALSSNVQFASHEFISVNFQGT